MKKSADIQNLAHKIDAFKTKEQAKDTTSRSLAPARDAFKGLQICIEFLSGVFIGLSIGIFSDWLFSSRPVFLALFGIFGVCAGVLNVRRFAKQESEVS